MDNKRIQEANIKYLKISKLSVLIPLPSSKTLTTQSKDNFKEEKGALIEASDSQNDIPLIFSIYQIIQNKFDF